VDQSVRLLRTCEARGASSTTDVREGAGAMNSWDDELDGSRKGSAAVDQCAWGASNAGPGVTTWGDVGSLTLGITDVGSTSFSPALSGGMVLTEPC
jgi:hypothetical protein